MSEELIQGQQMGQSEPIPAGASQEGQPAAENVSPQYVTAEQLAAFEKRMLSQAQSLVDKKGNAINAKIAQLQQFNASNSGLSFSPTTGKKTSLSRIASLFLCRAAVKICQHGFGILPKQSILQCLHTLA